MIALAAMLAGLAAWLLTPPAADARVRRLFPGPERSNALSPQARFRLAGAALGIGVTVLVGQPMGVVLGIAAAVGAPLVMARIATRADVAEQAAMERQVPDAVDLLAATLASGAPIGIAIRAVSDAQPRPLKERLAKVAAALELGADPDQAWQAVRDEPTLRELAAAFTRSGRTGAPLSSLLTSLGTDLRARRRTALEIASREAGVRAFVPLACCFLPSFVLLAGVPTVVTMAAGTGLLDSLHG